MVISFPYLVIVTPLLPSTVAKKKNNKKNKTTTPPPQVYGGIKVSRVEPLPLADFTFKISYLLVETHFFVHSEVKFVGLAKHLSLSNCERHTFPNFCPTITMCY